MDYAWQPIKTAPKDGTEVLVWARWDWDGMYDGMHDEECNKDYAPQLAFWGMSRRWDMPCFVSTHSRRITALRSNRRIGCRYRPLNSRRKTEMKFGMGLGWVQRRFAKPFEKGSIPSHASNLYGWTPKVRRAHHSLLWSAGTWLAVHLLSGRGPFRSAVQYQALHYAKQTPSEKMRRSLKSSTPDLNLALRHHTKLAAATAKLDGLQEQNIRLSRELTALRRRREWAEGLRECSICGPYPPEFQEENG